MARCLAAVPSSNTLRDVDPALCPYDTRPATAIIEYPAGNCSSTKRGEPGLKRYDLSNSKMRANAQICVTWEVGWAAFTRYPGGLPGHGRPGAGSARGKPGRRSPGGL